MNYGYQKVVEKSFEKTEELVREKLEKTVLEF